jgi:hypothetical protein
MIQSVHARAIAERWSDAADSWESSRRRCRPRCFARRLAGEEAQCRHHRTCRSAPSSAPFRAEARRNPAPTQFISSALRPGRPCAWHRFVSQILASGRNSEIPPLGRSYLHTLGAAQVSGSQSLFLGRIMIMDLDGAGSPIHFRGRSGIDTGDILTPGPLFLFQVGTRRTCDVSLRSASKLGTQLACFRAVERSGSAVWRRASRKRSPSVSASIRAALSSLPRDLVAVGCLAVSNVFWHFLPVDARQVALPANADSVGRWAIGPMRRDVPAQAPGTVSRDDGGVLPRAHAPQETISPHPDLTALAHDDAPASAPRASSARRRSDGG